MTQKFERPKQIIEYCLAPLKLDASSEDYKEVYRRMEHVVKTLQLAAGSAKQPIAVDFSQMRTLTINEEAFGND